MAPGSRSALFTIKPTIGHVTMDGVLGVARTFDSVGGMARSAEDLALLTEIIMDHRRVPSFQRMATEASWQGAGRAYALDSCIPNCGGSQLLCAHPMQMFLLKW